MTSRTCSGARAEGWSARGRGAHTSTGTHDVGVDERALVLALELLAADAAVGRAALGRERVALVLGLEDVLDGRERAGRRRRAGRRARGLADGPERVLGSRGGARPGGQRLGLAGGRGLCASAAIDALGAGRGGGRHGCGLGKGLGERREGRGGGGRWDGRPAWLARSRANSPAAGPLSLGRTRATDRWRTATQSLARHWLDRRAVGGAPLREAVPGHKGEPADRPTGESFRTSLNMGSMQFVRAGEGREGERPRAARGRAWGRRRRRGASGTDSRTAGSPWVTGRPSG